MQHVYVSKMALVPLNIYKKFLSLSHQIGCGWSQVLSSGTQLETCQAEYDVLSR